MSNKDKILLFFTSSYPFGKGEQFIETEIRYLAKEFREVHIFPLKREGECRALPSNARVIEFDLYKTYNARKLLFGHFFFIAGTYLQHFFLTNEKRKYILRFRYNLFYLMHRVNDGEEFVKLYAGYDERRTVVYSYWFNVWITVLALLKKRKKIRVPLLARAHGGDYDMAQKSPGYFPFRSFEMRYLDKLAPVSDYGKKYFQRHFSFYKGILGTAHLGVCDQGDNPLQDKHEFQIVSCSFLIPLKRVHLIISILHELDLPVKWTHIGDGELMEQVKKQAAGLPVKVKTEFKGHITNAEVIQFYKNSPVDLFINVSELEGIPVSIMEAISFGIPVVGCAVCGVPEIVNKQTGFLLEKDFDIRQAAALLRSYLLQPAAQRTAFRSGVKDFWNQQFNADLNYPNFIASMLS